MRWPLVLEPDPRAAPVPGSGERKVVLAVVLVWTLLVGTVSLAFHDTPLYQVETDLVGEYLPAAHELAGGRLTFYHYTFKGPGYPLLLAAGIRVAGGDGFLAARMLSLLAAAAAAWLAWRIARDRSDTRFAGIVLAGMLANPTLVHHAIESGTDTPALALSLAATYLALRSGGWRTALAAGAVASFAVLTRGNLMFLLPGLALALHARRAGRAAWAASVLGAVVPLGAWWLVTRGGQGVPADRNYLNVAWELYGRGLTWDQFESQIGSRFHSLASVFAYDPLHAARRVASNLFVHRWRDAHLLMPAWLGALAIPGVVLLASRPSWRLPLAFAALAALPLAAVFYNARFALYLLPFELAGVAAVLIALERRIPAGAVRAACAVLLTASAVAAGVDVRSALDGAPHEVRWAADALRAMATPGDLVMARKPHTSELAGLRFAAIPRGRTAVDLAAFARAEGVRYLMYSSLERGARPEYAALADSGFRLPGLEPVFYRARANHFAAVYEVSVQAPDSAAAIAALTRWIRSDALRADRTPEDALRDAVQLLNLGAYASADSLLADLERGGARDPDVSALRSNAWLGLGALDSSYAACERAMTLTTPTAWHWSRLGDIRIAQRRIPEARDHYRQAVALQPATIELWEELGRLSVAAGDPKSGAVAFERALALDPNNIQLRRMAMGAWQRARNTPRAVALYNDAIRAGISAEALMTGQPAAGR